MNLRSCSSSSDNVWRRFDAGANSFDERAYAAMRWVTDEEVWGDADSTKVRSAIVHTRRDMILLVSYLSDLNAQVRTLRRLIGWSVLLIVLLCALRVV